ncbi:MAG: hypothetical protein FJZ11_02030 [Candidatus Omnitrophica bacterium]|nr:hypothetical protein [Candidatus Omnitrophota bacterium]
MDLENLLKIDLARFTKNKNILANAGIVILALFITFNLHKAQVLKIDSFKNKITEEDEMTRSLGELKNLEDEIDTLKTNLASGLSSDMVIEQVSSIAGKYKIKIISIDSQATIDKEIYELLPIRMAIKSSFHNLGHMINDIEKTGIFKVRNFDISSDNKFYSEKNPERDFYLELVAITLKK